MVTRIPTVKPWLSETKHIGLTEGSSYNEIWEVSSWHLWQSELWNNRNEDSKPLSDVLINSLTSKIMFEVQSMLPSFISDNSRTCQTGIYSWVVGAMAWTTQAPWGVTMAQWTMVATEGSREPSPKPHRNHSHPQAQMFPALSTDLSPQSAFLYSFCSFGFCFIFFHIFKEWDAFLLDISK